MTLTLILGGARSGKTAFAQRAALAAAGAKPPLMIATAQAFDQEMSDRIARHREDRGDHWRTLETPLGLVDALSGLAGEDTVVVDCLTLWLSNLMMAEQDVGAAALALLGALADCPAKLWLVSNEVGFGIVPENALARQFRDEAGRLHQAVAAAADEVILIVAGLPVVVKAASRP